MDALVVSVEQVRIQEGQEVKSALNASCAAQRCVKILQILLLLI